MRKLSLVLAGVLAIAIFFGLVQRQRTVQAQAAQAKGGQDMFGAYEVVKGWPKDISTLPGNEKWTWGAGQSVYAESPNRVFLLFRGELPNIKRPPSRLLPDFGPSIQFPIGRLPWRDATTASATSERSACARIPWMVSRGAPRHRAAQAPQNSLPRSPSRVAPRQPRRHHQ